MATDRHRVRRHDGSAVVLGWVAIYTLGLPATLRERRRGDIAAHLADESIDAVRRSRQRGLGRRRVRALIQGIPDDLAWRFVDAPVLARDVRLSTPWVPVTRWSFGLLAVVAIGAAGALALVTVPEITGQSVSDGWAGWGPTGFIIGCLAVLAGLIVAVPWPRRALPIMVPGVLVGLLASPWLWGCWSLAVIAVAVRLYQAEHDASWPERGPGDR